MRGIEQNSGLMPRSNTLGPPMPAKSSKNMKSDTAMTPVFTDLKFHHTVENAHKFCKCLCFVRGHEATAYASTVIGSTDATGRHPACHQVPT